MTKLGMCCAVKTHTRTEELRRADDGDDDPLIEGRELGDSPHESRIAWNQEVALTLSPSLQLESRLNSEAGLRTVHMVHTFSTGGFSIWRCLLTQI